jgi:hypothetical protein
VFTAGGKRQLKTINKIIVVNFNARMINIPKERGGID